MCLTVLDWGWRWMHRADFEAGLNEFLGGVFRFLHMFECDDGAVVLSKIIANIFTVIF